MTDPILSVRGLQMRFRHPTKRRTWVHAIDDVDFDVAEGEIVGIVGESGSGKSTIGRCILGLETPLAGEMVFGGTDLAKHQMRRNRLDIARRLQVVFQDPYSSLNPFRTIGEILIEPVQATRRVPTDVALERARDMLEQVGLPREAVDRYATQFSGGQRQRIGIARALMMDPRLVICDESVSALDLSTQAQVLNLLQSLARDRGLAYIFIAHDLDVVRYLADRTVVLYRGRVMEQGDSAAVHADPLHPYTAALLAAVPVTDPTEQSERRALRATARRAAEATASAAVTTGPATGHAGCPFAARCAFAEPVCTTTRPVDSEVGERAVACHMYAAASGHTRAGLGMPSLAPQKGRAL
ncbi:oligopeptide/dipeptide ABC transporter ATP-binding protein [Marisediminicola sp. LYQ134]|uniref:oligopeptide/dipeptide ABC transporter ATP-binding protein n=1 Tax=Marisediminicola sp. LYQ134 TaxID=3391061 RepID=UPI0039831E12